jgi:hypothetical protein
VREVKAAGCKPKAQPPGGPIRGHGTLKMREKKVVEMSLYPKYLIYAILSPFIQFFIASILKKYKIMYINVNTDEYNKIVMNGMN